MVLVLEEGTNKELLRMIPSIELLRFTVSGSLYAYPMVGINTTTPSHTLDVTNSNFTINALQLRNNGGSTLCLVYNSGMLCLSPTGITSAMNIRGTRVLMSRDEETPSVNVRRH